MTGRVLFAPRGISLKTTQTARRPTPLRSREASPVPHRRFGPLAERQAETAIPPGGSSRETPSPGRLTLIATAERLLRCADASCVLHGRPNEHIDVPLWLALHRARPWHARRPQRSPRRPPARARGGPGSPRSPADQPPGPLGTGRVALHLVYAKRIQSKLPHRAHSLRCGWQLRRRLLGEEFAVP